MTISAQNVTTYHTCVLSTWTFCRRNTKSSQSSPSQSLIIIVTHWIIPGQANAASRNLKLRLNMLWFVLCINVTTLTFKTFFFKHTLRPHGASYKSTQCNSRPNRHSSCMQQSNKKWWQTGNNSKKRTPRPINQRDQWTTLFFRVHCWMHVCHKQTTAPLRIDTGHMNVRRATCMP